MTMQVFVRDDCTMIAAPIQCDVDGIPKGSHYARVPIAIGGRNEKLGILRRTYATRKNGRRKAEPKTHAKTEDSHHQSRAQIAECNVVNDYLAFSSAGFSKMASSTLPFTLVSVYVVTIVSASPKTTLLLVDIFTGPNCW